MIPLGVVQCCWWQLLHSRLCVQGVLYLVITCVQGYVCLGIICALSAFMDQQLV
jgi:hypothetical protein